MLSPILFPPLNTIQPTNGPTIPIETQLAPKVVSPPWASNNAWKRSTIVASTPVTAGPNNATPKPLPQGWEQLPVTDGIFNDERININAPETATNALVSGYSSVIFLIW